MSHYLNLFATVYLVKVTAFISFCGEKLTWLLTSVFVEITLVTSKPEKLAPSRQDIFQGMFLWVQVIIFIIPRYYELITSTTFIQFD